MCLKKLSTFCWRQTKERQVARKKERETTPDIPAPSERGWKDGLAGVAARDTHVDYVVAYHRAVNLSRSPKS